MRRSESMQQSSATQSLHLSFWGLWKIIACSHSSSQCLLVSTVFGTVSSLHPTLFLYLFLSIALPLCHLHSCDVVVYNHSCLSSTQEPTLLGCDQGATGAWVPRGQKSRTVMVLPPNVMERGASEEPLLVLRRLLK